MNEWLKRIPFEGEKMVVRYIEQLEKRYKVHINIDDLIGMTVADYRMEEIVRGHTYHNNRFCNCVKKEDKGLCRCIANKRKTIEYAKHRKAPFYGRCHMGIEELVYPVRWRERLIAVILVGQFTSHKVRGIERIEKQAKSLKVNVEPLKEAYEEMIETKGLELEALTYDIGLLSEYILQIYKNGVGEQVNAEGLGREWGDKKHWLLENTIRFIKENAHRELSLHILANNSYCNPTYLSHLFKEKMGISIVDYIQEIRIERAKHLLDITHRTVTEISAEVGFSDPNYFARVFKKQVGYSPKKYRQRIEEKPKDNPNRPKDN